MDNNYFNLYIKYKKYKYIIILMSILYVIDAYHKDFEEYKKCKNKQYLMELHEEIEKNRNK